MTKPHSTMKVGAVNVLISDADDAFYEVMCLALSEAATSIVTHRLDAHAHLMPYLHRELPFAEHVRPDVILMGMGILESDETDTLEQIKSDPSMRRIPIVFLTHPGSAVRIETLYEKGANSCLCKPRTPDACRELAGLIADYWFDVVSLA
jgi:CheY-like chemotaxis protein